MLLVEQAGNIPAGNVCPMASFASVPRSTWSVLSVGFGRIDVEVAAGSWKLLIKGSLDEKLPIYERHPSKVK